MLFHIQRFSQKYDVDTYLIYNYSSLKLLAKVMRDSHQEIKKSNTLSF